MPKYRVLSQYTITEEMFVDAKDEEEARESAYSGKVDCQFEIIDEGEWFIYDIQIDRS